MAWEEEGESVFAAESCDSDHRLNCPDERSGSNFGKIGRPVWAPCGKVRGRGKKGLR